MSAPGVTKRSAIILATLVGGRDNRGDWSSLNLMHQAWLTLQGRPYSFLGVYGGVSFIMFGI